VRPSSASYALAEEFTVIPFPFEGEEREQLVAEYALLLESGIKSREITDMVLAALEVLLNRRKEAKSPEKFDELTTKIADMLGRLLVYEEEFLTQK
jgi:hypothetical protein